MPRVTKDQLQKRVEELSVEQCRLTRENDELKKRISRGYDRSRSPRMPAANSQANVETTCKALNQVKLWQRDAVVEEQRAEIQRLQTELDRKTAENERLLRGEGPLGPVLVHAYTTHLARYGLSPGELQVREMSARTCPVHMHLTTLSEVLRDVTDFSRFGRCHARPTQLPY